MKARSWQVGGLTKVDLPSASLDLQAMLNITNPMKWIVIAAAAEAAATGLILFVRPALFAWLVFNGEFFDAGEGLARLTAIALFGMALATWPTAAKDDPGSTARALLVYNVLATIYLVYVGIGGQLTGILLWPVVALHGTLSIFLGRASFTGNESAKSEPTRVS